MKDEHVKDVVQDAAEDVPQDVAQDLAFRARAARALLATPPPPPHCLCAVCAEMGAQLGSSVAFGSGCGQTLLGLPRKAPLCLYVLIPVALISLFPDARVLATSVPRRAPPSSIIGHFTSPPLTP